MDYQEIYQDIISTIKLKGIPKYVKSWKPDKINPIDDTDFIRQVNQSIKKYHKHSFFDRNRSSSEMKNPRPMPEFYQKNNIGIIKLFKFSKTKDLKKVKQDETKLIQLIHSHLDLWESQNIKGLILDFSQHTGGSFWPLVKAFSRFLNHQTLFSWTNQKITKKDKQWINLIDAQVKYNQKYLSNYINSFYPIAIIIGENTISSGEFSAGMFYGKEGVKVFGKKSGGFASVNEDKYYFNQTFVLSYPETLLQTSDLTFHSEEYLTPNVITSKPIIQAIQWINEINRELYH